MLVKFPQEDKTLQEREIKEIRIDLYNYGLKFDSKIFDNFEQAKRFFLFNFDSENVGMKVYFDGEQYPYHLMLKMFDDVYSQRLRYNKKF